MSKILEQPRNFCTLGSIHSIMGINGAIPIVHSGSECCIRLFKGMSLYNGFQGNGYAGGTAIPNTNIHRPSLIYGGTKEIHRLIESTLKVMQGDLYVVLTGCSVELLGDDISGEVKKFQKKGVSIVYAETPGFKGSAYLGHEFVSNAIIEQLGIKESTIIEKNINLWVSPPYLDPFWSGNLEEIKNLLEGIGITVNILFGCESSVKNWRDISKAEINILVSPWVGLKTMKLLKKKFKTPFIHYPILPIGAYETRNFIITIAKALKINMDVAEKFVEKNEKKYYFYMQRVLELFSRYDNNFPENFFIIGDSMYVIALSNFLVKELGIRSIFQYITDNPPRENREYILEELKKINSEVNEFIFVEDPGEIKKDIVEKNSGKIPFIFGSIWDSIIAEEIKGYFFSISTPVSDRIILDCNYVGYRGALRLLEDIYSKISLDMV